MKVLIKLLISLVVIIVILGIAFVTLINLTPRQLKIHDIDLAGQTIEDLGLADTKFIDIFKSIKGLLKAEEKDVVKNGYNSDTEKSNSETAFEGSTLDNADNYSSVATEKVIYTSSKQIDYKDTTIAYILNDIVKSYSGTDEALKYLKDANIVVKEMTITVADGKGSIRMVCAMELGQYKDQIVDAVGSMASIFPIPDGVYIVSEVGFDVPTTGENQGVIATTPKSISINGDNDNPVTKAIVKVILGEGQDLNDLNGKLGEAVSSVIKNLGLVGTADKLDADKTLKNDAVVTYGMNGVKANTLTLITYTA